MKYLIILLALLTGIIASGCSSQDINRYGNFSQIESNKFEYDGVVHVDGIQDIEVDLFIEKKHEGRFVALTIVDKNYMDRSPLIVDPLVINTLSDGYNDYFNVYGSSNTQISQSLTSSLSIEVNCENLQDDIEILNYFLIKDQFIHREYTFNSVGLIKAVNLLSC